MSCVTDKGHQTPPHLGTGSFGSLNCVIMIAFADESALRSLIAEIEQANATIKRRADHIRLFQSPLESIVRAAAPTGRSIAWRATMNC
jgi:hypothetical protein